MLFTHSSIFQYKFLAKIPDSKTMKCFSLLGLFAKNSDNAFFTKDFAKLMVPSESAPQELSIEWSCQYVSTMLTCFGEYVCPALGNRSHNQYPSLDLSDTVSDR
jgi:hypothetical protein